jgi:hypothetical protein
MFVIVHGKAGRAEAGLHDSVKAEGDAQDSLIRYERAVPNIKTSKSSWGDILPCCRSAKNSASTKISSERASLKKKKKGNFLTRAPDTLVDTVWSRLELNSRL